jgi:uncharacterized membrane protein
MCPWIWKSLIIIGLGMTFFGLILMIESKVWRQNGKTYESTGIMHPSLYKMSWILTILGYLFQIIGVIFS